MRRSCARHSAKGARAIYGQAESVFVFARSLKGDEAIQIQLTFQTGLLRLRLAMTSRIASISIEHALVFPPPVLGHRKENIHGDLPLQNIGADFRAIPH